MCLESVNRLRKSPMSLDHWVVAASRTLVLWVKSRNKRNRQKISKRNAYQTITSRLSSAVILKMTGQNIAAPTQRMPILTAKNGNCQFQELIVRPASNRTTQRLFARAEGPSPITMTSYAVSPTICQCTPIARPSKTTKFSSS